MTPHQPRQHPHAANRERASLRERESATAAEAASTRACPARGNHDVRPLGTPRIHFVGEFSLTNVKLIACVGLTFLTAGCHPYEGPTEEQIESAVSESLRSFDSPPPSALGRQWRDNHWASNGRLQQFRNVKSKEDCKKQSDLLYACHIDIFMASNSNTSFINLNPTYTPYPPLANWKITTTMNFVYRDGTWHVADEHKGWFGQLIVEQVLNSIGIPVIDLQ